MIHRSYTITMSADWDTELNPTNELEFYLCDNDDGQSEAILSFGDKESGDFYAQAKIDKNKAELIVAILKNHFKI